MLRLACSFLLILTAACNITKLTVNTTSKVLAKAQPSMKQESDYELAARAIPGTLKTVEGFHMVDPSNMRLKKILAEGFCQYATGFVEDEWEVATLKKDFEMVDYHSERATKMFFRCMGYGLELLGGDWKKAIAGDLEAFRKKVAGAGNDERDGLLWTGVGLAGAINQNKDDINLVSNLPRAKAIFERIVELDAKDPDRDKALRALPHIALGSMAVALSKTLGGDPPKGLAHFKQALALTDNKFLLVKVFLARRYAVAVQDRALFRKTLVEVLQTDPAIWPDQRLANEIAHRKAKRYLKNEKEWF
jgi:tetratricopeptide (TPR) repeat protein